MIRSRCSMSLRGSDVEVTLMSRTTAVVKWFDGRKGFGFAVNPDGEDVLISHRHMPNDLRKTIKEGDQVTFDQIKSEKGYQGENIER